MQDPPSLLLQIAGGYPLARCLHTVASLGVADALHEAPSSAAELAAAVGAHPDALERALRLLAAHGVFEARDDGFVHTPASRLLRTDDPRSLRAFVELFGLPLLWDSQGALMHSLRTGRLAAEEVQPGGFWGYLAQQPEARAIFNAAMAGKAQAHVGSILAAYDFSGFGSIADIGGGRGHLLRAVLDAVPSARGVLFDLPPVIEEVGGLACERLRLQAGDFFKDALPVCDGYLLMEVIHDWDDRDALAILRAVRRAAPAHAKLLLIEQMIPDDPGPHWAKTLDLHMLALLGGRQRSGPQYTALLEQAGFTFQRQVDTCADIAIVEAAPTPR
jgi:O-methyltransferase domain/Dimerisation domain